MIKKRKNNNQLLQITKYIVENYQVIQPIKIHKILYFLYLEYLKEYNEKLFKEEFEAWVYGPVLSKVFTYIRNNGFNFSEVENIKTWSYTVISPLENKKIITFIDKTIPKYLKYETEDLVSMAQSMPWIKTREGLNYHDVCTKKLNFEDMKEYAKSTDFNF